MGALNLAVPTKSALIPQWIVEYLSFVRSLASLTISYTSSPGDPGGGALQAGPGNVVLRLNLAPAATQQGTFSGTFTYAKTGGGSGQAVVLNGLIMSAS